MHTLIRFVPFMLLVACTAPTTEPDAGSTSTSSGGASSTGGASSSGGAGSSSGGASSSGTQATPPRVSSTMPANLAPNVWLGQHVMATFDEPMNPASLQAAFTLSQGNTSVTGVVSYSATTHTATFAPASPLGASLQYTAAVSTAATSAAGLALAEAHTWTFTTHSGASPAPVNLGTAGNYAILAKTQISTVPASVITGDLGLSPAAATFITGFSPMTMDATGTFSTSAQVTGRTYAADYTSPTPAVLTTAIGDMGIAFTDASGRASDVNELGAGDVGGMTLAPGVYKWGTGLLVPTDVTLSGGATDVWIFQVAQDLTVANATRINLAGGALAKNVFWQVSGLIQLGTTAHVEGILMSQTAITLATGSTVNGRLLAQSAVTLDTSTVTRPAP